MSLHSLLGKTEVIQEVLKKKLQEVKLVARECQVLCAFCNFLSPIPFWVLLS